jgi:transcription elongation factor GreA
MDLPEELANRPPRKGGQVPTSTLTLDAYLRLRGELDELKASGRVAIAERLKSAREQALMESRIRNLERMLRDPELVEGPAESEVVASGMLVTLRPLEEDEPEDETYLLAESAEERASGVRTITTTSPLGKALLGANLEDQIAYEAPGGTFHYRVVAFEPRT